MHESVAQAIYRGDVRAIPDRTEQFTQWFRQQPRRPSRRAAWLRSSVAATEQMPGFAHFLTLRFGTKKHAEAHIFGAFAPQGPDDPNGWVVAGLCLSAKTMSVETVDPGITITHHAVARLVQRINHKRPTAAVGAFAPGLFTIIALELTPSDESMLLPAVDGGVVAVRDRNDERCWAFVTYVHKDQLRADQKESLRFLTARYRRAMHARFGLALACTRSDGKEVELWQ